MERPLISKLSTKDKIKNSLQMILGFQWRAIWRFKYAWTRRSRNMEKMEKYWYWNEVEFFTQTVTFQGFIFKGAVKIFFKRFLDYLSIQIAILKH